MTTSQTLNSKYNKLNASFIKATAKMEKLSALKNFTEAELISDKLNNMQENLSKISAQIEKEESVK